MSLLDFHTSLTTRVVCLLAGTTLMGKLRLRSRLEKEQVEMERRVEARRREREELRRRKAEEEEQEAAAAGGGEREGAGGAGTRRATLPHVVQRRKGAHHDDEDEEEDRQDKNNKQCVGYHLSSTNLSLSLCPFRFLFLVCVFCHAGISFLLS